MAAPLAHRMRPRTFDEVVGQDHVAGRGAAFRKLAESGELPSCLLWGPPGSGKTTLALLAAEALGADLIHLSAVEVGVAEVRKARERARKSSLYSRKTVLFLDEVHRFNRAQQDSLLGAVEAGELVFIGATTENPFSSLVPPLVSRCLLFRLEPLSRTALITLLERALADAERGLGGSGVEVPAEALEEIAARAGGDARAALSLLEACVGEARAEGSREVGVEVVRSLAEKVILHHGVEEHYDLASAFIKSVRGCDPDAALYWLARMLEGGEDPLFIARRLVILASEDVGLADPAALPLAVAALQAVEKVGLPEARLALAEATIYLARAPKSNAVLKALEAATREVQKGPVEVPLHLRQASAPGGRSLGYGRGYIYPHDHPSVEQRYLPEGVEGGFLEREGPSSKPPDPV